MSNTSELEFINIVCSTTMDVDSQVALPGGPYTNVHSARLDKQDKEPEHNGSSRFQNCVPSANEVNDAPSQRQKSRDIFARPATQMANYPIEVIMQNISPIMQANARENNIRTSHLPYNSSNGASEWHKHKVAQPPAVNPIRVEEDYDWSLGTDLQDILKFLPASSTQSTPKAVSKKRKAWGKCIRTETSSSVLEPPFTPYSSPTKIVERTRLDTPPSPPWIDDLRFTPSYSRSLHIPSTPPTSPPLSPSPVVADAGSGRTWSEVNQHQLPEFSSLAARAQALCDEDDDESPTVGYGATSPPASADSDSQSWAGALLWGEGTSEAESDNDPMSDDDPTSPIVSADGNSGLEAVPKAVALMDDEDSIFNHDAASSPVSTDQVRRSLEGPVYLTKRPAETLFDNDDGVTSASLLQGPSDATKRIRPPGSNPIITRRPIEELNALKPENRKFKFGQTRTKSKRPYQRKPKETPVQVPSPPRLFAPTSKQTTIPSRGSKRAASPVRSSYVPPAKRPATQANNVRIKPIVATPSRLAQWTSWLSTWEDRIYQGKQGSHEIPQMQSVLREMLATKVEALPARWLGEKLRTRMMDGMDQYKDRRTLVRDILDGYRGRDEDGELERCGQELLAKWVE